MLPCVLAMFVVVPSFVVGTKVDDTSVVMLVLGIIVEGTLVVIFSVLSASTVVDSSVV